LEHAKRKLVLLNDNSIKQKHYLMNINLIQYKKVDVLGEDKNNLASNAATWHK
jgi:hypothetical protein